MADPAKDQPTCTPAELAALQAKFLGEQQQFASAVDMMLMIGLAGSADMRRRAANLIAVDDPDILLNALVRRTERLQAEHDQLSKELGEMKRKLGRGGAPAPLVVMDKVRRSTARS